MKTTARLMYLLGISFLLVDVAYFVWSLIEDNFELIGLMTIGSRGCCACSSASTSAEWSKVAARLPGLRPTIFIIRFVL